MIVSRRDDTSAAVGVDAWALLRGTYVQGGSRLRDQAVAFGGTFGKSAAISRQCRHLTRSSVCFAVAAKGVRLRACVGTL